MWRCLSERICCHNSGRRAWREPKSVSSCHVEKGGKKKKKAFLCFKCSSVGSQLTNPAAVSKYFIPFFIVGREKCSTKRALYSTHVCPFKHWPPWPPPAVRCGRFLTMMPQQAGSPLEPAFLRGPPRPPPARPSSTSALITGWHARHVTAATPGQRSVDSGFGRKSRPVCCRNAGCITIQHEYTEDLQWM